MSINNIHSTRNIEADWIKPDRIFIDKPIDEVALEILSQMTDYSEKRSSIVRSVSTSQESDTVYAPRRKKTAAIRKKVAKVFRKKLGLSKKVHIDQLSNFTRRPSGQVMNELRFHLDFQTFGEIQKLYDDFQKMGDIPPNLVQLKEYVELVHEAPQVHFDHILNSPAISNAEKGRLIASIFAELPSVNMTLLNQSLDLVSDSQGEFLSQFVNYLLEEAPDKALHFLKERVGFEVKQASSHETLFRSDSIFSKALRQFLKTEAKEFADEVIQTVVDEVEEHGKVEVDPKRLTLEEVDHLAENQSELLRIARLYLESASRYSDFLSDEIKEVCQEIHDRVRDQFEDESFAQMQVTSLIFLRFLNPLLTTREGVSPETKRGLILVAKLAQTAANRVDSGKKEVYKEPYLKFADEGSREFNQLIDDFLLAVLESLPNSSDIDS